MQILTLPGSNEILFSVYLLSLTEATLIHFTLLVCSIVFLILLFMLLNTSRVKTFWQIFGSYKLS